jgi:hypothetical protein
MKRLRALTCLSALLAGGSISARAQTPPAAASEAAAAPTGERMAPERLELTVLKVYTATDGKAKFRAYVVKWKDQEVIVSDSLVRTNYAVGDTIPVLAMNHPFPQNAEERRLLAFTVGATPRSARP